MAFELYITRTSIPFVRDAFVEDVEFPVIVVLVVRGTFIDDLKFPAIVVSVVVAVVAAVDVVVGA